jgi:hypothetical protein
MIGLKRDPKRKLGNEKVEPAFRPVGCHFCLDVFLLTPVHLQ